MNHDKFMGHYVDWREKRIAKLVSIFGKTFFNEKEVLELGCGTGFLGEQFIKFGSKVTFCDARGTYLSNIRDRLPDSDTRMIDQNYHWNLGKKFDFIIHTGVLYHLTEWRQDLTCALNHSDLIFLETIVSTSTDEEVVHENGYDQAVSGVSVRPSTELIEKFLTEQGTRFTRHDDSDLNSSVHKYDWVDVSEFLSPERGKSTHSWPRRFWIIYND